MGKSGEYHSRYPERDYVISGNECVCGVEVSEILRFLRPAEGRERPESRAEPCIERVLILLHGLSALRADRYGSFAYDFVLTVLIRAVVCGNAVSPPELTGDAPVADILHPAQICVLEVLRDKLKLAALYNFDSGFCERLHLNEPLLRAARLYNGMTALTGADIVDMSLCLYEKPLCFKIGYHSLSCLVSVHSGVFSAVFLVYRRVIVHDVDYRQIMAKTYFIVVRVMCGSYLYDARSEIHFDIFIRNDRYLTVGERELYHFPDYALIAFVIGMNSYRGIAEKCFGTRGRDLNIAASVGERIVDMPEVTLLFLIHALDIRYRGLAARAPVYDALAVIYEPLLIIIDEYLLYGVGTALVKSKALTFPVT